MLHITFRGKELPWKRNRLKKNHTQTQPLSLSPPQRRERSRHSWKIQTSHTCQATCHMTDILKCRSIISDSEFSLPRYARSYCPYMVIPSFIMTEVHAQQPWRHPAMVARLHPLRLVSPLLCIHYLCSFLLFISHLHSLWTLHPLPIQTEDGGCVDNGYVSFPCQHNGWRSCLLNWNSFLLVHSSPV